MDYFIHETAVIDKGAVIGKGVKVWHFSHIMPDCIIGQNCVIFPNVHRCMGQKPGKQYDHYC